MYQKVFRFKITLSGIEPQVWRVIDVPEHYQFWELHVAIQDVMGWLDYHLHEFSPRKAGPTKGKVIGIPESDSDESIIAGWELPIKKYFTSLGNTIDYLYDFGDSWHHEVILIGMFLKPSTSVYPQCLDSQMACPPEDCGGLHGYQNLLKVLSDKKHKEYEDTVEWLRNHAKNYWPYKSNEFKANKVKFSNPHLRWSNAFE